VQLGGCKGCADHIMQQQSSARLSMLLLPAVLLPPWRFLLYLLVCMVASRIGGEQRKAWCWRQDLQGWYCQAKRTPAVVRSHDDYNISNNCVICTTALANNCCYKRAADSANIKPSYIRRVNIFSYRQTRRHMQQPTAGGYGSSPTGCKLHIRHNIALLCPPSYANTPSRRQMSPHPALHYYMPSQSAEALHQKVV